MFVKPNKATSFMLLIPAFAIWILSLDALGYQVNFEDLYNRWHKALDTYKWLTEPMYFRTDNVPEDFASMVNEIVKYRTAMATFVCEKVADEGNVGMHLYKDLQLLNEVSGINLWVPERPGEPVDDSRARAVTRFRLEWRRGIYADPSAIVRALCENAVNLENGEVLVPQNLSAIRRYGIFGLPELIRQVKLRNSKHAFAAFLIISHQREEYSRYIVQTRYRFPTVEAKLDSIKEQFQRMATEGGNSTLMKSIAAELVK